MYIRKKTKFIIIGIIAIILSWLFAKLSIDSSISTWYGIMSIIFGFFGVAMGICGLGEMEL